MSKYYHTDGIGSVRGITDGSQNTTDTALYDSFGNVVTSQTSWTSVTPFRFAGAWQYQSDGDTSLQLLGNRYYDSNTGHFLSKDPAQSGSNWYAYCGNNPVSRSDPSGLWVETVLDVIGLIADAIDFVKNPSAGGAAMLGADVAGVVAPGVPSPGAVKHGPSWIGNLGYWIGRVAKKIGDLIDPVDDFPRHPVGGGGGLGGGGIGGGGGGGSNVFSGHGTYMDMFGETVMPSGTSLTFYCPHGGTIPNSLGNIIETGRPIPAGTFTETFGPGMSVPNYLLHPPGNLSIQGNPITVTQPTPLNELLQPGMGDMQWAACRKYGLDPF